jgi:hypothetical protein
MTTNEWNDPLNGADDGWDSMAARNLRARVVELEAERDAAKAEAEKLKVELAAEENNCPYPDFSCGTFAAERGIELRPAGGPTYTTTSDHWQGILRDLEAAKAGEARAVEALRRIREELETIAAGKEEEVRNDFSSGEAHGWCMALQHVETFKVDAQPASDWLAHRDREAAARELEQLMEGEWKWEEFGLKASFNARIADLRDEQPTACPRSEVRGEGES